MENKEGEEEIPEEWAIAIEEAEWDYDPDYVEDNKEEVEEEEKEKEPVNIYIWTNNLNPTQTEY